MATATKARRGKTDEQRAAEVEALTDKLHAAVADLTSSEAWLRMLAVSARFTRYSWRNQVLLWLQAEDRGMTISRVAGSPGTGAGPSWVSRSPRAQRPSRSSPRYAAA
jgi:predicted metal-dependent enzyme (double-stranded beta helix superfamily)